MTFASFASFISDCLSSAKSFVSASISFLITVFKRCLDFNIASNSFFSFFKLPKSVLIFSSSSFANLLNRKFKIASACVSLNLKFFIKIFFGFSSFLIILIILSILRYAIIRPAKIWMEEMTLSNLNCNLFLTVSVLY